MTDLIDEWGAEIADEEPARNNNDEKKHGLEGDLGQGPEFGIGRSYSGDLGRRHSTYCNRARRHKYTDDSS